MASGQLFTPYCEPVLDGIGNVVAGASLTFYNAGTTTLAAIFADAALATPVANPQSGVYGSNSAGRFTSQTTSFWGSATQAYDILLNLPDGSSLTFLNQYALGAGADTSGFAPINSPIFTGVPQAPTPSINDNSAKLATTAYVQGQGYAPLNSPTLTGTPTAPTAAPGTNTTQLATTAFVATALGATARFTSAETPISGTSVTVTHGLSQAPFGFSAVIRNKIAEGGYAVSDEIAMPGGTYNGAGGGIPYDNSISSNATNLTFAFTAGAIQIANKSTGAYLNINNANWMLVFRAWT